eukprot:6207195-Pleurochrysis_carterae.AAC.7
MSKLMHTEVRLAVNEPLQQPNERPRVFRRTDIPEIRDPIATIYLVLNRHLGCEHYSTVELARLGQPPQDTQEEPPSPPLLPLSEMAEKKNWTLQLKGPLSEPSEIRQLSQDMHTAILDYSKKIDLTSADGEDTTYHGALGEQVAAACMPSKQLDSRTLSPLSSRLHHTATMAERVQMERLLTSTISVESTLRLEAHSTAQSPHKVLVVGVEGVGKSTFVNSAIRKLIKGDGKLDTNKELAIEQYFSELRADEEDWGKDAVTNAEELLQAELEDEDGPYAIVRCLSHRQIGN